MMKVVAVYNYLLHLNLKILGTKLKFIENGPYPIDRPIILVANHQGTFDIPALIWYFRKHHVKFVAKSELKKGFPCISYTLNRSGSVFADRKKPKEAIEEIKKLGKHISENNFCAVIFPEGRRSRQMIKFRSNGLEALLSECPNALIVPVAISGLWAVELKWPMKLGSECTWECLESIEVNKKSIQEITTELQIAIEERIIA